MREIYERLVEMVHRGVPAVVATVVRTEGSTPRKAGAKMLIAEDGRSWGTVGGGGVEATVIRDAASVLREGSPRVVEYELTEGSGPAEALCGGRVQVFFEPLRAGERLYIFGAGHVAQPLARMAKGVGFRVTVIDRRGSLASRERFGEADEILVKDFAEAAAELPFGPDAYVVVVTPNHEKDEEVVRAVLGKPFRYVGMIGSEKKVAGIRSRLADAGFPEEVLGSLHAPIGLEIGAETPEEIAVSILAELVAVRRKGVA